MSGLIVPVPDAEFERIELEGGAWVDVCRGWLDGAGELFDALRSDVPWQTSRLFRYDHWVEERRLGSMWRLGTPLPHPALATVHKTIERRYGVQFPSFGLIQYRDGADGQAFHRDTDMKFLDNTIIAILTLGARRPWHLRPWASKFEHGEDGVKGATHDLSPGSGDLIVMGGRAQADWQHSVPYLRTPGLGTRISLQWRWTSRTGKPFQGTSYRAPLNYGR